MKHYFRLAICIGALTPLSYAGNTPAKICAPPAGFVDTPPPPVAGSEQLVSHTEQIVIDRPFPVVADLMDDSSDRNGRHDNHIPDIKPSGSLPGAAGIHLLSAGPWGAPGARRIVCLTDGGITQEQVLVHTGNRQGLNPTGNWTKFRYIVWGYTTPRARPVDYGIGEFNVQQVDDTHTRVTWTYSFKLNEHFFPGSWGALGRWLFRVRYLDGDYARMMRASLSRRKNDAEQR